MGRQSNVGKKVLVGHHLMRTRIRTTIFVALQEAAEEETRRTGEQVSVSDMVRVAVVNFLCVRDALLRMENTKPPPGLIQARANGYDEDYDEEDEDEDEEDEEEEEEIIFNFP